MWLPPYRETTKEDIELKFNKKKTPESREIGAYEMGTGQEGYSRVQHSSLCNNPHRK